MRTLSLDIPWLAWPEVCRIVEAFKAADVELGFYGGSVRDTILGNRPSDFDIIVASNHAETKALLERAGLTVTVLDDLTMRADINGWQFDFLIINLTEERVLASFREAAHERAAYTEFTINSFLLFPPGPIYACASTALSDLSLGRLAFIGDPDIRINERAVYILRFFRLYAWYGKTAPEAASLTACVRRSPAIPNINQEFLRHNMTKLLAAPQPYASLRLMQKHGVLLYAMGFAIKDFTLVEALGKVETLSHATASWHLRAAALFLSAPLPPEKALAHVAGYWGLEKDDIRTISLLLDYCAAADPTLPKAKIKTLTQELGGTAVRDLFLLRWAMEEDVEAASAGYQRAINGMNIAAV